MEKWKHPEHYIGEEYYGYYVLLGQNRDSGVTERANFIAALKRLGGESDTVIVARARHWLVGWVEGILIHESDAERVKIGNEIERELEGYPILDHGIWSELEQEEVQELLELIKRDVENGRHGAWNLPENPTDDQMYECAEQHVEV